MKNYIFILTIILFTQGLIGQPEQRDVLAVQGAPGNSYDWHPEINSMRNDGYQIREAFSIEFFSTLYQVSVNVDHLDETIKNPVHNYTNVLGLGHDTGGLAIRGLKASNPQVTGQILVGTPNRGSSFLRELNNNLSNDMSSIENFVQNIDDWKGGIDCPDCDKTKNLLEYLASIKQQPYSYGAINDPNSYYNTLPEVDHTTTAVIWGNKGDQTLGHLIGSTGGVQQTSNVDFQECEDRLKAIIEAQQAHEDELQIIKNTSSFFSTFLSIIGKAVKTTFDADELWQIGSDFVKNQSDRLLEQIKLDFKHNKELEELLICELANQRLEAEWIIKVQGEPSGFVSTLIESPDYDEELCEHWTYQCQYNTYHPDHNTFCQNQELYCGEWVYQLEFEENDFVYTRTEQTIPGSINEYEIEANHLQEQQWERNQVPLMELYSGNVHEVFYVPKI